MAKVRSASVQSSNRSDPQDHDRRPIGSQILRNLPKAERAQILPLLEFVRLKLHQLLNEAGEVIRSAYFLNDGLPVIFGFTTSATRVVTQGEGTAYRIDVDTLRRVLPQCPGLARQLQRFAMILGMQSTQLAACNRLHQVEERLARWLLMSHDRIREELLPLTQEFLGQMLGTRRASVSVAAGTLQKAGMIKYTRGSVTIRNRSKLEAAACDCYGIISKQASLWNGEAH
jgi:hypothetical protein